MLSRRGILKLGGAAALSAALLKAAHTPVDPDYSIEIAPFLLEISPKHTVKTIAYNRQIPGEILRLAEGRPVIVDVTNHTSREEVVHWHGLFLPSDVDGAMEEGTPMVSPGSTVRYTFTPRPAGFRWYHTHTRAGNDLKAGQYTGQQGFLMIEPRKAMSAYDREFFLALHDWDGQMFSSGDGSMNPAYNFSTINGKMLGFGEPLKVKQGQRVLLHILNASPTDPHWISFSGHQFRVIALDGNPVPQPQTVPMLRLAPAERVCAIVEMSNPGVWVLGEVRKHIKSAGMGVVVEYSGYDGAPLWQQPQTLNWNYNQFAALVESRDSEEIVSIPLVFESKFAGHGAPDRWMINGKSYPDTEAVTLRKGQRYRLQFKNRSTDDHPVHLHRHSFEIRTLPRSQSTRGIVKDVVLVPAQSQVDVEFTADNPGLTLFHCHQQNHMDDGFMMLFRYA